MRPRFAMPWIHIVLYAALLAGVTVALQWLDYQRLVRSYPSAIYDGLLATGFLALGLWLGMRLLGRGASPAEPAGEGNPRAAEALGISPRELEVLRLLAQGKSNREIADRLVITELTVRTHVSNILSKLHLASRTQAALYALKEGLASLDDVPTDPR